MIQGGRMHDAEYFKKNGLDFEEQGHFGKAIEFFYKALELDPSNENIWTHFAHAFRLVQFTNFDGRLKAALVRCLDQPIGNHQDLVFASLSLLKLIPEFKFLLQSLDQNNNELIRFQIRTGDLFKVLNDPLLIALMKKTILPDPQIEKLLTIVRREILEAFYNHEKVLESENVASFIYALSTHCFLNEYVYMASRHEMEQVEALCDNLAMKKGEQEQKAKLRLALIGCYLPLHRLPHAQSLSDSEDKEFKTLIKTQVDEPLEEEKLEIPHFGSIKDDISLKVQAQYEANPYPRWTSLNKLEPTTLSEFVKKHFSHSFPTSLPELHSPTILVAGCGTGQHVFNTAHQFKNAHVLGVDLSRTSLAYAMRKAELLDVSSVEFLQADILELKDLNQKFDVIECTGVLHHMHDPVAGLRSLVQLLRPGGLMQIGLYSEIARQDIVAAHQFIAERGYTATQEDIQKCRQAILSLPEDHLIKKATLTIDFYTLSTCRDLLFHVQEHRFDLLQIAEILKELNLEFLGFELRDTTAMKKYRHQYPDDVSATSLAHWHQFEQENPDTFAGMYQFWLRKKTQTG